MLGGAHICAKESSVSGRKPMEKSAIHLQLHKSSKSVIVDAFILYGSAKNKMLHEPETILRKRTVVFAAHAAKTQPVFKEFLVTDTESCRQKIAICYPLFQDLNLYLEKRLVGLHIGQKLLVR